MFTSRAGTSLVEHEHRIQANYVYLLDHLDPPDDGVVDQLVTRGIFTPDDLDHVIHGGPEGTRRAKVARFLDLLIAKGRNGFPKFMDALHEVGCQHIAEKLEATDITELLGGNGNKPLQTDTDSPSNYVITEDFKAAADLLDQRRRVVLCGPPGSGKTATGHALLELFLKKGHKDYVISHVQDWDKHCGEKCVLLMDGTFGEVRVDPQQHSRWRATLPGIQDLRRSWDCLLVITVYPHILHELQMQGSGTDSPLLDSIPVVHLMRNPLSEEVKRDMLTFHLQELHLEKVEQDALVTNILLKDLSGAVFPWCCKQLVQNWPSPSRNPSTYFTNPSAAYVSLFQRMRHHPVHGEVFSALLALSMLEFGRVRHSPVQSHLEALGFHPFSDYKLNEYADVLKGSVLNQAGDRFINRVIYDAAGLALGRSSLRLLLKVCDVKFLVQHVSAAESNAPPNKLQITIDSSSDDLHLLMQTIYSHVNEGRLMEICQYPFLQSLDFQQDLEDFLHSNGDYLRTFFNATDALHKTSLLCWSVWGTGFPFTKWCLRTLRDLDADESVLLNSLLKAVCVCLMSKEQSEPGMAESATASTENKKDDEDGVKFLLQNFSAAHNLSERLGSVTEFPIPAENQCFTNEAKAKRARLMHNAWTGRPCYLGSPFLPIPSSLISVCVHDYGDKLRVMVPSRHWYLVLRLLADGEVDEKDEEGNTVLHVAAEAGMTDAIMLAVRSGASVTTRNNKGRTPVDVSKNKKTQRQVKKTQSVFTLHEACKAGDKDTVVVELLTRSVSVHDMNDLGQTSVHAASESDQAEITSLLVGLDADVNVKDDSGDTPLFRACRNGHLHSASFLIDTGADVNVRNNVGRTALHSACLEGHHEIALLLIKEGARTDLTDVRGHTALHFACRRLDSLPLVADLICHGADVNAENSDGETPFHEACSYSNTNAAHLLIEHGADPRLTTKYGDTALHSACRGSRSDVDTVDFVLHSGVDVNAGNNEGQTALYVACTLCRTEMVIFLLEHGANPDVATKDGDTPLHKACYKGCHEITEALLETNPNIAAADNQGNTPLHIACSYHRTAIASLLIQHKIGKIQKHESQQPALAKPEGERHSKTYLKGLSSFVDARNHKGETPLFLVSKYGDADSARLLVEVHFAKVDAVAVTGETPLAVARRKGHRKTAELLIQHGATIQDGLGTV